jgi:hypothetical protein
MSGGRWGGVLMMMFQRDPTQPLPCGAGVFRSLDRSWQALCHKLVSILCFASRDFESSVF